MTLYSWYLLYHEIVHLIIAMPIAYICYKQFSKRGLVAVLLATFLTDVDHFFVLFFSKIGNIGYRMANGNIFDGIEKPFLFFHSFELVLLLFLAGFFLKRQRWIFYPTSIGLFYHIIVDVVSYFEKGIMPWHYTWMYLIFAK